MGPDPGYAFVCGGYHCVGSDCGLDSICYRWEPDFGAFVEESSLVRPRWVFMMTTEFADMNDTVITDPVPMAIGFEQMTEVYNPITKAWRDYMDLPEPTWFGLHCLIAYEDMLYYINTHVEVVDPTTWNHTVLTEVPQALAAPTKCVGVEIGGSPGIFTRFGYWFNLDTLLWEAKASPQYEIIVPPENSMWSFRGRPTIFGHPKCDAAGDCINVDVIQYDPIADEWGSIGAMNRTRRFMEVIEVPGDFCDAIVHVTTDVPPTTTGIDDTTTSRFTTPDPLRDNAALIIGGYWSVPGAEVPMLDSVEIVGCTGADPSAMELAPFPRGVYQAGGAFVDDNGGGHVFVCGGLHCEGSTCLDSEICYKWRPLIGIFNPDSTMVEVRVSHIIAQIQNLDEPAEGRVPVAIGGHDLSEVYGSDGDWSIYRSLPTESNWNSANCLVQHGDFVYSIPFGQNISRLDTLNWDVVQVGRRRPRPPGPLARPLLRGQHRRQRRPLRREGLLVQPGHRAVGEEGDAALRPHRRHAQRGVELPRHAHRVRRARSATTTGRASTWTWCSTTRSPTRGQRSRR